MAQLHRGLADFRTYAATRKWQSLMTAAVVSFLVCHIVAEHTLPPYGTLLTSLGGADSPAERQALERQLLHFGAVILRFALPYAFFAWGVSAFWSFRRAHHVRA